MKIRIFALARDLGLDSKVLIDLCEEAGVKLRNALATISEEERDQVVAYIKKKGTTGAADAPAADLAPVRDQPSVVGKVRVIGTPPTRPNQRSSYEEESEAFVQDIAPVIEEAPVIEPAAESEVEVSEAPEEAPAIVTPVAEAPAVTAVDDDVETPVIPDPVAVPVAPAATSVPAAPTTVAAAPVSPAAPPAAQEPPSDMMRRPRMQQVREMRPIGSVKDREQAAAAAPAKPAAPIKVNKEKAPPRPLVAAPPDYVPPVVKKPKP